MVLGLGLRSSGLLRGRATDEQQLEQPLLFPSLPYSDSFLGLLWFLKWTGVVWLTPCSHRHAFVTSDLLISAASSSLLVRIVGT